MQVSLVLNTAAESPEYFRLCSASTGVSSSSSAAARVRAFAHAGYAINYTALPEEGPAAENRTWSVLAFFSPNVCPVLTCLVRPWALQDGALKPQLTVQPTTKITPPRAPRGTVPWPPPPPLRPCHLREGARDVSLDRIPGGVSLRPVD